MNILELPNELLILVFSYLGQRDLVAASEVCRRFNDISKFPALWKKANAKITTIKQLTSFCNNFVGRPLQELSLSYKCDSPEDKLNVPETVLINNFLRSFQQLSHLSISNIDPSGINFPLTLKRLSILNCKTFTYNHSLFCSTLFPSSLEHLSVSVILAPYNYVDYFTLSVSEEVKRLVRKYANSLTALSLHSEEVFPILECTRRLPGWVPVISSCMNLKHLTFNLCLTNNDLSAFFSSMSMLPFLEVLHFTHVKSSSYANLLSNGVDFQGFPELRELHIYGKSYIVKSFTSNALPKLETFILNEPSDRPPIVRFLFHSQSLKNFGYANPYLSSFEAESFIDTMACMKRIKRYESLCLCTLLTYDLLKLVRDKVFEFYCKEKFCLRRF